MRRITTLLTMAVLVLAAGSSSALAGAKAPPIALGVAPSKLQTNLIGGQLYQTDLDIYNKGGSSVTLDVYLQDYTISTASVVEFHPAASLAESAAGWSTLGTSLLHMAPHSHQQVHLTVNVPRDAAIGTHTLAVIFRSRQLRSDGNVKYQPAVASLMAAGVENADGTGLRLKGSAITRSVEVNWIPLHDVWTSSDHVGAAIDWLLHPTVTAHIAIKNEGNTFFNVIKGGTDFTTSVALGGGEGRVAAPTYTILPSSVRSVDMTWKDAPLFARGDAETRIYYNDAAHLPVVVTPFEIIPWHLITVVGVLLALFVSWRLVRRRRHGGRVRSTSPVSSPWMAPGAGV
ncbi:MAG: hypothetical protein QOF08_1289 [Gaiellales bacterium]|nr:hypothetical protein [Gaiellales bacterium]